MEIFKTNFVCGLKSSLWIIPDAQYSVCLLPLTFFTVAAPLSRISLSPRGRYHLMYQVDCEQFKMVIHNVLKYGHDILPAALAENVTRSVVSVCLPVSPSKTNLTFLHLLSHVHSTQCVLMRLVWYWSSIVGSLGALKTQVLENASTENASTMQTFSQIKKVWYFTS